jgi:UDP-N-acetyl-D-mannosaminuronate dehydrogenase
MRTLEYISAPSASLTAKLEDRTARIGVISLGYVGLPLVLLFSEQDFRITGFDIDRKKVDALLQKEGAQVSYNDPYFEYVGRGRKYNLEMRNTPLDNLKQHDCVIVVTDHSSYDFAAIVEEANLVVDTRNATQGMQSAKVVRC